LISCMFTLFLQKRLEWILLYRSLAVFSRSTTSLHFNSLFLKILLTLLPFKRKVISFSVHFLVLPSQLSYGFWHTHFAYFNIFLALIWFLVCSPFSTKISKGYIQKLRSLQSNPYLVVFKTFLVHSRVGQRFFYSQWKSVYQNLLVNNSLVV